MKMGMKDTRTLGVTLSRAGQKVPISAEGRAHLQFGFYSNGAQLGFKTTYRQVFQRFLVSANVFLKSGLKNL